MWRMVRHELRSTYKSLFGWIAGVLLLQTTGYTKFEGFQATESASSVNAIARSFPKAMLALFGMSDLNLGTLIGYFGILYLYFALIAIIHAGLIGSGIISKEERDKTSEFLLTRPVSRNKILTSKLLAGLINILILFTVIAASSVVGVAIVNHGDYSLSSQIMDMMWGILMMQLLFFSLGVLFAGIFKHPKLPTLAATTAIVASYLIYIVSQLNSNLEWLRFVTPFRWFAAPSIIYAGGIGPGYVALVLVLSMVFIALGFTFYNRRDITVA